MVERTLKDIALKFFERLTIQLNHIGKADLGSAVEKNSDFLKTVIADLEKSNAAKAIRIEELEAENGELKQQLIEGGTQEPDPVPRDKVEALIEAWIDDSELAMEQAIAAIRSLEDKG